MTSGSTVSAAGGVVSLVAFFLKEKPLATRDNTATPTATTVEPEVVVTH